MFVCMGDVVQRVCGVAEDEETDASDDDEGKETGIKHSEGS